MKATTSQKSPLPFRVAAFFVFFYSLLALLLNN